MRFLSVCSGIEAASCAWHPLGWKAVGFSEIEKFPSAVLAHHYPHVPNLGDMTRFQEWPDDLNPDVLVGGTPCQSFSVAGLRKGLSDSRGNLALVYLALADRYRPEWLVWENVPGVLSSAGGRDFGAFLGALVELGYGFAYRVLDAQYFACAAPRARVFVVGNRRDWRRSATVLLEPAALSGNPAPGSDARLEGARTLGSTTPRGRGDGAPLIPCWWDGGQLAQTADAVLHKGQTMPDKKRFPALIDANGLRFATPREWERMLGFPDDYTNIRLNGKATPDGPRYKALGNSMAVPCMRWIGERIDAVHHQTQDQAA
jgi:DNA (cytosine-5)-methyltransferase 1